MSAGWQHLARWANPRTVRTRVTVVAGLALTAAVLLGLGGFYLLQRDSARHTTQSQLHTYAIQVAQSARDGVFPRPLAPFPLDRAAQAQVLSRSGRVLATTRNLAGLPPVYQLAARSAVPVRQRAAARVLPGEVSVYGQHTIVGGRPVAIITLTTTSQLSQVNETFARLLAFGVPGLLILACTTVWVVTGRALRPVERISGAVTAISHADLSQRVPQPGTDDEIGHLARTMNEMLARLEDSAARQRRFAADASHELRSPLTAIRTSLEVGLAHPGSAPWPDIARRAARQTERLEKLIAQLLELAKSDAHRLAARRQPVDLAALLTDICTATAAPGISMDIFVPPGMSTAGNPEDLSRMFRNLIDNAAQHARQRVLIAAAAAPDGLIVEIIDDGPGIPASERERVFDRFVRLDASREHASGSAGLGLAIAREIATAHSATITLTESDGGGTRAVITLPATARAGRPSSRAAPSRRPPPSSRLPLPGPH